jgi:hypothetical protein
MRYPSTILFFFCLLVSSAAQNLKRVTYQPAADPIINPERGMYHVRVTGMTPGKTTSYDPLQLDDLLRMRASSSLLFRYFGLKEWRTTDLPDSIVRNIAGDFAVVRSAGLKTIIRFAYAAAMGEPDASLETMLRHLEQLKHALRENADVIAVMQGGFIGAWGEWHSSSNGNDSPERMKIVLTKILETLPRNRMVQVRAPSYKQTIFSRARDASGALSPAAAFNGSPIARVGHHNDCVLADASDMGTYMRGAMLDTLAMKEYLRLETRFVPMGGETCQVSEFSMCEPALREMERLRWSFLNGDYDGPTLAGFVKGGCMNVIEERLGYRLRLLDAEFTSVARVGGKFILKLRLINEGWASPYNERGAEIVLRHAQRGELFAAAFSADPRRWLSGDTALVIADVGIPAALGEGTYSLFLNFFDPAPGLRARPEYSIRLANANTWEAATGFNRLLDSVRVIRARTGDRYRGSSWFAPRQTRSQ